jgi:hypothetical protein
MDDALFFLIVGEQLRLIHARMFSANESERRSLVKAKEELLELLECEGVRLCAIPSLRGGSTR